MTQQVILRSNTQVSVQCWCNIQSIVLKSHIHNYIENYAAETADKYPTTKTGTYRSYEKESIRWFQIFASVLEGFQLRESLEEGSSYRTNCEHLFGNIHSQRQSPTRSFRDQVRSRFHNGADDFFRTRDARRLPVWALRECCARIIWKYGPRGPKIL